MYFVGLIIFNIRKKIKNNPLPIILLKGVAHSPQEKLHEKPQEQLQEKPQEKPQEKSHEKPQEQPQEKPQEKLQEQPQEKPQEKPKEKPKTEESKPEEKPKVRGKDQQQQKQQQQKQQQPKQQQPKGGAAPTDEGPDVSHLDIAVGRILSVVKHPDADTLFIEQIDVGEKEARTIVSGLVGHVDIEDLKNRDVLVLMNLKPKNARGVASNGMVLCATIESNGKKEKVEPLDPPAGVVPGERVTFEGIEMKPDQVLNPKKKNFEKAQEKMTINEHKIAVCDNIPFMTSKGPITVKSIVGGIIS